MYIEAVPNRNSPPAILLRESYREGRKVRKRTLCNLSDWPAAHIEGLRGVLRGGTVIPAGREAFTVIRTLPHGHVAAALGTARRIGLDRILGPDGNRCRDLVLALLVGRILEPASKLAAPSGCEPLARKRDPLRGIAEIALAVGAVLDKHRMAKHFDLAITDVAFSFAQGRRDRRRGGERWHLRRAHQPARRSARRRGGSAQL